MSVFLKGFKTDSFSFKWDPLSNMRACCACWWFHNNQQDYSMQWQLISLKWARLQHAVSTDGFTTISKTTASNACWWFHYYQQDNSILWKPDVSLQSARLQQAMSAGGFNTISKITAYCESRSFHWNHQNKKCRDRCPPPSLERTTEYDLECSRRRPRGN